MSAPVVEHVLRLPTAEATRDLGRRLGRVLRAGDLLVLSGDLGAGKTTLTQGIGEGLGVRGPVTSPTFVLSRVHPSLAGGPALVHVDAYRLADALELEDLDLETDLAASVVVVEWGRGLVEDLAGDRLEVDLHRDVRVAPDVPAETGEVDERRTAVLRGVGQRWAGLAP
ncbi:tRNA (adenosine(37)-N6)-threonylcarbamoyltransferase complex ATPase subunit type 1 TsaE [Pseudokineococcus basanitobsidens]|uniref:tRNA threonylcarbamoyladenosine biosynthesis protein TsaE n=1 Tax=Pseudokineococcus basanitobsidens TaxID=1926649 RepID=A0ABU8RH37_9ACTN